MRNMSSHSPGASPHLTPLTADMSLVFYLWYLHFNAFVHYQGIVQTSWQVALLFSTAVHYSLYNDLKIRKKKTSKLMGFWTDDANHQCSWNSPNLWKWLINSRISSYCFLYLKHFQCLWTRLWLKLHHLCALCEHTSNELLAVFTYTPFSHMCAHTHTHTHTHW